MDKSLLYFNFRTFIQVSTQWQDTESMRGELDDLQVWGFFLNILIAFVMTYEFVANVFPLCWFSFFHYILFFYPAKIMTLVLFVFSYAFKCHVDFIFHLQMFICTRWAILLNFHAEISRLNSYPFPAMCLFFFSFKI